MTPTIPDWVTRGKTIRQLIAELSTFEDLDREVRLSVDDGGTHHPISLVVKQPPRYCVLITTDPGRYEPENDTGGQDRESA